MLTITIPNQHTDMSSASSSRRTPNPEYGKTSSGGRRSKTKTWTGDFWTADYNPSDNMTPSSFVMFAPHKPANIILKSGGTVAPFPLRAYDNKSQYYTLLTLSDTNTALKTDDIATITYLDDQLAGVLEDTSFHEIANPIFLRDIRLQRGLSEYREQHQIRIKLTDKTSIVDGEGNIVLAVDIPKRKWVSAELKYSAYINPANRTMGVTREVVNLVVETEQ